MAVPVESLEVWHRRLGELGSRSPFDLVLFGFRPIKFRRSANDMAQTSEIVNASGKRAMFRAILGWALCLLLAFVFLMVGGMKLVSKPVMVREFEQVGLGQWFRYFTGALEVTGAVCLLVPKVSRWGALLLMIVMVGAIIAHFTVLHSPPTLAAILLLLAGLTAWLRR
jgi:putative oxidoreductase